jgi:hypothetical protein
MSRVRQRRHQSKIKELNPGRSEKASHMPRQTLQGKGASENVFYLGGRLEELSEHLGYWHGGLNE